MIEELKDRLGDGILVLKEQRPGRLWGRIDTTAIRSVFAEVIAAGGRFATMTGIDMMDGIEINYHFCFDDRGTILTLAAVAPWPDPTIDSLGQDLPAALWIEREIADLLGVSFTGHPDMRRLILPDDWPEGSYPLRRDFRQ